MIAKLENPKYLLYGAFLFAYSMIFLIAKPQDPAVFLLWVFSILLLVIRIRFNLNSKYIYIDLLLYIIISIYNPSLVLLTIPPIMLSIYKKQYMILTHVVLISLLIVASDLQYHLVFVSFWIISVILQQWNHDKKTVLEQLDNLRNKTYKSEQEKKLIMASSSELSRISILSERDRIAQVLHDNLGHELTGALLALRAYETVHKDSIENKSFSILKTRLEESVAVLQNTVSKTKPEETYGYEKLKEIVNNSLYDNIEFITSGDILQLTETHFYFITTIIKEALTNAQKHAQPTYVQIQIVVDNPIIRVKVKNDGVLSEKMNKGFGLQYMRKRLEAIKGTLTYRKSNTFTLICVLPFNLNQEMKS